MGAIVDVLLIGKAGIRKLAKKYPSSVIRNMTNSSQVTQQYRVIIPGEDLDEGYYQFLVDEQMALASLNFRMRLQSDAHFKERMMLRREAARNGKAATE